MWTSINFDYSANGRISDWIKKIVALIILHKKKQ